MLRPLAGEVQLRSNIMTDYNEPGKEYLAYSAPFGERFDSGVFSDQPYEFLKFINDELSKRINRKNSNEIEMLSKLNGCMNRLKSFLFCSKRLMDHAIQITSYPYELENLSKAAKVIQFVEKPDFSPPGELRIDSFETGADFESMIFHGGATLDKLAQFVSQESQNPCNHYSQLEIKLREAQQNDIRAEHMFRAVNECKSLLTGILLGVPNKGALRNKLIHESSLFELTKMIFVIHWLEDGSVLRFDHEIFDYPLLGTTWSLTNVVTYLVMKAAALYLGRTAQGAIFQEFHHAWQINRGLFTPKFDNPIIHFSKYKDPEGIGPIFSVGKTLTNGFTIDSYHIKQEVFHLAESPPV